MDSTIPWPANLRNSRPPARPAPGKKPLPPRREKREAKPSMSADVPSLVKSALGPLECEVLREVCNAGELSARQVLQRIDRSLAYTTVMTTLARLYRKGLLSCRASGKALLYTSRLSSAQLELQLVRDLVQALLACKEVHDEELAAAIVNAMRQERPELLRQLRRAMLNDGVYES
jgi:predicted transcriptional regulator